MCTGRVDLSFVLRALSNGTDGVFIGGCHLGECHYVTDGNYSALNMVQLCRKILVHIGVNPERLRIEWMSAGEGIRFAAVMNDFGNKVKELGPLGEGEGIEKGGLKSRLEKVIKLVPYIKLVMKEKLALHLENEEDYNDLYTSDEIDSLFRDVVSYHIDPDRCKACMICLRRCPTGAIDGGKKKVHVIDQEKCIKCGTCYDVCPPRFEAVTKRSGEAVPLSVPEEKA